MKMRRTIVFTAFILFVLVGCGSKTNNVLLTDQTAFFDQYNAAAEQIGIAQLTEGDLEAYVINSKEEDGFSVREDVLAANMLTFTPGQVMIVGRPSDFEGFYYECQAVLMAATEMDLETADAFIHDVFFKEDAVERQNPSGIGSTVEKTEEHNGIEIHVSQTSGIYMLIFSPK